MITLDPDIEEIAAAAVAAGEFASPDEFVNAELRDLYAEPSYSPEENDALQQELGARLAEIGDDAVSVDEAVNTAIAHVKALGLPQ